MVTEVNRLVGDVLAAGLPLALPGVGTLRPERRPARRISKKQLLPPARAIDFSSTVQGTTLARRLADAAHCPQEQAEEIYGRWLGYTLQEGVLTIEGVGTLKMKHFALDPAFDRRINPQGHAPITVRRRRRFDWTIALGLLAIVAGAAVGGYGYLLWKQEQGTLPASIAALLPNKSEGAATVAPNAGRPAADAATAPVTDSAGPRTAQDEDLAPNTAAPRTAPTAAADEPSGAAPAAATSDDRSKPSPTAADGRTNASAATTADRSKTASATADASSGAAATAAGRSNERTATADSRAKAAAQTAAEQAAAAQEGVMTMTPGRYYVVLGVFSTVENAERAVKETARKEGSMRCGIYRFGTKWMVSPFESADAEACTLFRRAHTDRFPDTWVYRAR